MRKSASLRNLVLLIRVIKKVKTSIYIARFMQPGTANAHVTETGPSDRTKC